MNLQGYTLKQDLINLVNNSGLPLILIHYILKDIADLAEQELNKQINLENEAKLAQEQQEQEIIETEEEDAE